LIAATVNNVSGPSRIIAFSVKDGQEQLLTPKPWPFTARVEWLPDMSGLLVIAGDNIGTAQVWFLSYPGGEKRKITNELNIYRALGLTADATKMITVQASGLVNILVAPAGDAKLAVQLPTGNVGFYAAGGNSVSWTPDGHIVFMSNESTNTDIWLMDSNGGNRKQLTSNMGQNFSPVVSRDGRYIVFSSTRVKGRNIWRMDIDGSNPKQLTNGLSDGMPAVSPDSKWVVYSALGATGPTLWKVAIEGGNAVELTSSVATAPIISPDGKLVAYMYPESKDPFAPANRIAIISFEEALL
jgi:WD40 repeat protein